MLIHMFQIAVITGEQRFFDPFVTYHFVHHLETCPLNTQHFPLHSFMKLDEVLRFELQIPVLKVNRGYLDLSSNIPFRHWWAFHENVCIARPRKQRYKTLYSLFLVTYRQCMGYNWERGNNLQLKSGAIEVCGAIEACLLHQKLENILQAEHM